MMSVDSSSTVASLPKMYYLKKSVLMVPYCIRKSDGDPQSYAILIYRDSDCSRIYSGTGVHVFPYSTNGLVV